MSIIHKFSADHIWKWNFLKGFIFVKFINKKCNIASKLSCMQKTFPFDINHVNCALCCFQLRAIFPHPLIKL